MADGMPGETWPLPVQPRRDGDGGKAVPGRWESSWYIFWINLISPLCGYHLRTHPEDGQTLQLKKPRPTDSTCEVEGEAEPRLEPRPPASD